MSYTNTTTNYDLPQYVATDTPNWLNDINGAFSAIDTAMHNNAESSSENASDIASLESSMTSVQGDVSTLQSAVSALQNDIPSGLATRLSRLETLCEQLKGGCFSTYPVGQTND